jgi:alpha-glucosidase
MVFYGDEAAINAPTLTPPEHDPYSRAPYPWEDETGDVHLYGPPDHEMIGYYQRLAALRRGHSALRTGSFVTLLTGDTSWPNNDDTTYAFARSNDHEVVIVMLNKGKLDNKPSVPVGDYFPDGTILRDALTGKAVSVSGGRIEFTLAARGGAVLLKV